MPETWQIRSTLTLFSLLLLAWRAQLVSAAPQPSAEENELFESLAEDERNLELGKALKDEIEGEIGLANKIERNSGFSSIGKRAWNSGFSGMGKRVSKVNRPGEKRAWNSGFSGVGKRAWNSGFAGMGKRAWNSGFAGMGKRAWNSGFAGMGKRAWNSGFAGMGKRAWNSGLAGLGKRSPLENQDVSVYNLKSDWMYDNFAKPTKGRLAKGDMWGIKKRSSPMDLSQVKTEEKRDILRISDADLQRIAAMYQNQ